MSEPCDRKRCRGSMETWASELRPDGTWWAWLVCDVDNRHVTERDSVPPSEQDKLPGMDVGAAGEDGEVG